MNEDAEAEDTPAPSEPSAANAAAELRGNGIRRFDPGGPDEMASQEPASSLEPSRFSVVILSMTVLLERENNGTVVRQDGVERPHVFVEERQGRFKQETGHE